MTTNLGTLQGTNYRKYNGEVAANGKSFVTIKTNIVGGDLRDPVGNVIWSGTLRLPIVGGTWAAQLPPTDDESLSAHGFVYLVTEELEYKPRAEWRTVATPLPGGTVVNMADLPSGIVVPPFPPEQGVSQTQLAGALAALPTTLDAQYAHLDDDGNLVIDGEPVGGSGGGSLPDNVVPHVPWIEAIAAAIFGHSYYAQGGDENTNQTPAHRVQRRLRHQVGYNLAAGGASLAYILGTIKANYQVNTLGIRHLCCLINNSNDNISAATTREQMRSVFAYLTARAKLAANDSSFAYGGGWSAGVTSTPGSYVDFAWDGDAAYVAVEFTTGATTSVTVTDSGATTPTQTLNTGGYGAGFTGMIRLKGYGSGPHTVRIRLVSGSGLTVTGALVPSPFPPTIAWLREGPLPAYDQAKNTLLTVSYREAIEPILVDFPSVVKIQYDERYSHELHATDDGYHLNNRGIEYATGLIVDALATLDWRHGQNNLHGSSVVGDTLAGPAYVGVIPAFVGDGGGSGGGGGGATVPGTPQNLTATPGDAQIALSWSAPASNGGAAVSDYVVQYRVTSVGQGWTTFADGVSSSTGAVVTGLTNGTYYDFRVAAVNSAGTGAYTAVIAAVPASSGGGGGVTYTNVTRWSDGAWLYVDALPSDPSSFPATITAGDTVTIVSGPSGWIPGQSFVVNEVGVFGIGPGGANRRLISAGGQAIPPAGSTGGTVSVADNTP